MEKEETMNESKQNLVRNERPALVKAVIPPLETPVTGRRRDREAKERFDLVQAELNLLKHQMRNFTVPSMYGARSRQNDLERELALAAAAVQSTMKEYAELH